MFKNEPKQDSSMWKAQSNLSRIHSQPKNFGTRALLLLLEAQVAHPIHSHGN